MKIEIKTIACVASLASCSVLVALPQVSQAQTVTHWVNRQLHVDDHYHPKHSRHHQSNNWRSLSYIGGGVAVAGILTGNPALAAIGITGGLYSTYRFEQDRHSS